jgi:hypothetical protein
MELQIAATNHFDPLCPIRLKDWLRRQQEAHALAPEFVAVEWDRDTFEKVRAQRPDFRALVIKAWPSISPFFADALTATIAFEGDTHLSIFPEAEILWLDAGREVTDPTDISEFAKLRLVGYEGWFPNGISEYKERLLERMSAEAWTRAEKRKPDPRDWKFASAILARIEQIKHPGSAWAICIVGANHASNDEGHMRAILEAEDVTCVVSELRH